MRRFALAVLCALTPVQVLGDAQSACDAAWVAAQDAAGALGGGLVGADVKADDGWCEVVPAEQAFLGVRFHDVAFRVDQLAIAAPDARSLEVVVERLDTPFGPLEGEIQMSFAGQTGEVTLHQLDLEGADGRRLRVNAQFLDLDPTVQVSLPARVTELAMQDVRAQIAVTPAFLQETGIDFSDLSRVAIDRALRDVGPDAIDRATRNELQRFVGAAPDARGTLDLVIGLDESAGLMQIIGPFLSLNGSADDAAITRAFGNAFDGMQLDLAWKPGRM